MILNINLIVIYFSILDIGYGLDSSCIEIFIVSVEPAANLRPTADKVTLVEVDLDLLGDNHCYGEKDRCNQKDDYLSHSRKQYGCQTETKALLGMRVIPNLNFCSFNIALVILDTLSR